VPRVNAPLPSSSELPLLLLAKCNTRRSNLPRYRFGLEHVKRVERAAVVGADAQRHRGLAQAHHGRRPRVAHAADDERAGAQKGRRPSADGRRARVRAAEKVAPEAASEQRRGFVGVRWRRLQRCVACFEELLPNLRQGQ